MREWNKDELHKIAEADDLHISPFREDGASYGTPTWIVEHRAARIITRQNVGQAESVRDRRRKAA